jgi:hypothetical protein
VAKVISKLLSFYVRRLVLSEYKSAVTAHQISFSTDRLLKNKIVLWTLARHADWSILIPDHVYSTSKRLLNINILSAILDHVGYIRVYGSGDRLIHRLRFGRRLRFGGDAEWRKLERVFGDCSIPPEVRLSYIRYWCIPLHLIALSLVQDGKLSLDIAPIINDKIDECTTDALSLGLALAEINDNFGVEAMDIMAIQTRWNIYMASTKTHI